MKVILLEEIKNLGRPGDMVEVKSGYFRNFLSPKKLAAEATPANIKIAEKKKVECAKKSAEEKESAVILSKSLASVEVKLFQKAGDKNQLFGSVTNQQIAEFLNSKGYEIDKHKIILQEPIKHLGNYEVQIKLHPEVVIDLKVSVEKEEQPEA